MILQFRFSFFSQFIFGHNWLAVHDSALKIHTWLEMCIGHWNWRWHVWYIARLRFIHQTEFVHFFCKHRAELAVHHANKVLSLIGLSSTKTHCFFWSPKCAKDKSVNICRIINMSIILEEILYIPSLICGSIWKYCNCKKVVDLIQNYIFSSNICSFIFVKFL